jgi:hypothetical protein
MSEHRLGEIVIERPRHGMRISPKKLTGYRKELEKITRESTEDGLLRPYLIKNRHRTKHFSDNLSPLRRWLRSKVGQPWDIVYSEICQKIETRTLCGQHLLVHLEEMVEDRVRLIEGMPHSLKKGLHPIVYRGRGEFYVHPETRMLCRVPQASKTLIRRGDIVEIDATHQYRCKEGIWFYLIFSTISLYPKIKVWDVWLNQTITYDIAQSHYDRNVYVFHKRHCTKKEIKTIMKNVIRH